MRDPGNEVVSFRPISFRSISFHKLQQAVFTHAMNEHVFQSKTKKENVCMRIEFNSQRITWDANMAAVHLFGDISMTSRENSPYHSTKERFLSFPETSFTRLHMYFGKFLLAW